jgi:hypothetical protein
MVSVAMLMIHYCRSRGGIAQKEVRLWRNQGLLVDIETLEADKSLQNHFDGMRRIK